MNSSSHTHLYPSSWAVISNRPKTEQKQKTIYRPNTQSGKLASQFIPKPSFPSKLELNVKKNQQQFEIRNYFQLPSDPLTRFSQIPVPSSQFISKRIPTRESVSPEKQFRYAIPLIDKKYPSLKDESNLVKSSFSTTNNNTVSTMNESNLRKHTEDMRRIHPISTMERIALWARKIPAFEPLDLSLQENESNLSLPSASKPSSSNNPGRTLPSKSNSFNESLPSLGMSELEALRHIPKAAGPPLQSMSNKPSQLSSTQHQELSTQPIIKSKSFHSKELKERARGKLLCCLKVEIKSGEYKMLPVHEKDEPQLLAFSFCKSHNLISSISNLTEHIRQSKKTYG